MLRNAPTLTPSETRSGSVGSRISEPIPCEKGKRTCYSLCIASSKPALTESTLADPVDHPLRNLKTVQLSACTVAPYVGGMQGANILTLLSH